MSVIDQLFGRVGETGPITPHEVVAAIGLAFVLTVVIAAVYRHTHRGSFYTRDYVHTLMLLGMVVTAVMMVVGHSVERAFAIFAAFSVIRFRRSLPETRDIGFVFFAMAVGMAAGARQYALAVLATLTVCGIVLVISWFDLFAPARQTHVLRLRMSGGLDFEPLLRPTFASLFDRVEIRSVETAQAGTMTEARYAVSLRPGVSHGQVVATLSATDGVERVLLLDPIPERDF